MIYVKDENGLTPRTRASKEPRCIRDIGGRATAKGIAGLDTGISRCSICSPPARNVREVGRSSTGWCRQLDPRASKASMSATIITREAKERAPDKPDQARRLPLAASLASQRSQQPHRRAKTPRLPLCLAAGSEDRRPFIMDRGKEAIFRWR